jgi:glycosyltransferase involved in cell wall biosynthesis
MRILIVSQHFWPENFRINSIALSLYNLGHKVDVLTGKPNYPKGEYYEGYSLFSNSYEMKENIQIFRVPLIKRSSGSKLFLILNYLSFIIFGFFMGPWLLRRKKYDLVFVYATSPVLQAFVAILIAKFKKTPLILWVQDLWPESLIATGHIKNVFIHWLIRQAVRYIYHHSDLILISSKSFEDPIKKYCKNKKIIYYPNSIDIFPTRKSKDVNIYFKGLNNKFIILFTGNIGKAQSINYVVDAAKILKKYQKIHFLIVGDGSARQDAVKKAKYLALDNISFPGQLASELMPGLMDRASALLITLNDHKIFSLTVPSKLQAYLSAGKPILGSVNGEAAKIIIESKSGLAAPANSSIKLAEIILEMYHLSEEKRKKMGMSGKKYFNENFNHFVLTKELISIFKNIETPR